MPHKRNPIASENLCGLARVVRANSLAGMDNVALWHERDISHSSVERIVMPDSTILVDYMLVRMTDLIRNLVVYRERMQRNLDLTGGLVYSQRLLLELVERGAQRKEAYEAVQRNAMQAWEKARLAGVGAARGADFKDLVAKDPLITKYLSTHEIEACFDPTHYLRHVRTIFHRVFGAGSCAGGSKRARR